MVPVIYMTENNTWSYSTHGIERISRVSVSRTIPQNEMISNLESDFI